MKTAVTREARSALDTFTQCGLGVVRRLFGTREVDALIAETERLWREQDAAGHRHPRYGLRPGPHGAHPVWP